MSCLPSQNKCEWSEIKFFVDHYNSMHGSAYRREACLDVQTRDCAQPEMLCRDDNSGDEIVIERKLLVWPLDYVERHKNEHDLFERTLALLSTDVRAQPFTLRFTTVPHVRKIEKRTLLASKWAEALQSTAISLMPGQYMSSSIPFPWALYKEFAGERDEDEPMLGFKIVWISRLPPELSDPLSLPTKLIDTLHQYYASCERKFASFESTKKVLLLQWIPSSNGSELCATWWLELFRTYPPPPCIDEIWSALNYGEDQWAYSAVYERHS